MRIVFLIPLTLYVLGLQGQCLEPGFSVPAASCIGQNITVTNETSLSDHTFAWDFCSGDLTSEPEATEGLMNSNFFRARSVKLVSENGKWYGFLISATANLLMRLDFESDLRSTPSFYNMGNPGTSLSSAFSFDAIKVQGIWHFFVANGGNKNILRFSFQNGMENAPEVTVIQTSSVFDVSAPNAIEILEEGGAFYSFVSVGTTTANSKVVRLRFGNSILNELPEVSEFSIPGGNQLRGMSFTKECDQWNGLVLSVNTNSIYRLQFQNGLENNPSSTLLNTESLTLNTPVSIEVRKEGGLYYALVQNARIEETNAAFYKLSFGESIFNDVLTAERFQSSTLTGGAYALDVVEDSSSWYAFTVNLATQKLVRMDFDTPCSVSIPTFHGQNPPPIRYSSSGDHRLTLDVEDGNGNSSSSSQVISVSSLMAPHIGFTHENNCTGYDVVFTPAIDGSAQVYEWSFGDGNLSTEVSPVNQYTDAGAYEVNLVITASNGCQNMLSQLVDIYQPPVADFIMPSELFCTKNLFTFETTTPDSYNGHLSYQWFVDNNPAGTDRDLEYSFTTTGPKEIKLITSIPGCQDEVTKTTSSVEAGPIVDFAFAGNCVEETFSFTPQISDPFESLIWDFGNGETATTFNAEHTFASYGQYNVSLTATNAVGCENTTTREVRVYSRPVVDFQIDGPPNACAKSLTEFENLTVNPDADEITAWSWTFDLPGQPVAHDRDATYTFDQAGLFDVSLTASTTHGCESTTAKEIEILPSPSSDFNFTPACVDVPVTFTGPAGADIASWYWEIGTSFYTRQVPTHTFRASGSHDLELHVTGTNGCVASQVTRVEVPAVLVPDFSVAKNCVGEQAHFVDITSGGDPVATRMWSIAGSEVAEGQDFFHSFSQAGEADLTLEVTTTSGCVYSRTKAVPIVSPPVADFSATPSLGAYPLEVDFQNRSVGASSYHWAFLDGAGNTSADEHPVYTFYDEGTFDVVLTAVNLQQCVSTSVEQITTLAPLPDADIEMISLASNDDGSLRLIVTIHNKGNTILREVPLELDFSGELRLKEIIQTDVQPGSKHNYVLTTAILNPDELRYLCASIEIENDRAPAGNRACKELEAGLLVLPAFPNPASNVLNVEWISSINGPVKITLTDTMGRTILAHTTTGFQGLNRHALLTSGFESGIYILSIESESVGLTQRVVIGSRP